MIFRSLDSDGDWNYGRGKADLLTLNNAIGENIRTRLQSWVGDCFFDLPAGIDWLNRLGQKNQRALLELDIKRVILQSEGVTGLLSFSTSVTGRKFSADYSVETVYSASYQDRLTLEL